MRAVDIKGGTTGSASALYISDTVQCPIPSPTECLVRVRAFGLNRADTLQREGKYPMAPHWPKIMGLEFSGTIEEVGTGASDERHDWKVGDKVFGLTYGGAYAEYVAVEKRLLMQKPGEMSWEECAGVPEVWFTALQALYLVGGYDEKTTQSILWHAGASAVSIAGIQLSLAANESVGLENSPKPRPVVLATARQDAKCDLAKSLGAAGAVNTSMNTDWVSEIKKMNGGRGVDLLIDFLGGPAFESNLAVMNLDGRIVLLGLMAGFELPPKVNIAPMIFKRLRFEGSTLRTRVEEYQSRLRDLFEDRVMPGMIARKFDTKIDTVVSWKEIGNMHERFERNATMGKIVCMVD